MKNESSAGEITTGCKIFGAYKAYCGIDGITPIIHGPVGCYWSNVFFQLAHNESYLKGATSALHDRDVVFGSEKKLKQAIEAAKKYYHPEVIAILGCCVPALIGEDVGAVRKEEETPTIFIDAAGFKGKEWEGYEDALLELLPFIEKREKKKKRVNLLGFDPISPKARADIKEIKRLLKECGYQVNAALSVGTKFSEVREMAGVEKNILMGGYGFNLAKAMQEKFGVPYEIVDFPYGAYLTREFLSRVAGCGYEEEVMEYLQRAHEMLHRFYDMPVAIIGDYDRVNSLKKFLSEELGCEVKFTSVISGSPIHPEMDDDLFNIHKSLRAVGEDIKLIFGTSYQKRVAHELGIPLIRISHPTYDEVYLHDDSPYMGYRGTVVMIEKILNLFLDRYPGEEW